MHIYLTIMIIMIIIIQSKMQNQNKTSQYFYIFSQCQTNQQTQQKLTQFKEYLQQQQNQQLPKYFATTLKQKLATTTDNQQIADLRQIIVVSQWVAKIKEYRGLFENIGKKECNVLGDYIMAETQYIGIRSAVLFVEKMFLEYGMVVYSHSSGLFQAFLNRFLEVQEESVQELLTELLVEMLLDNHKLIKLANNPYYFLEFWLHVINQEPQLDRKLYWLESVKKLYSVQSCEEGLFYESDFKTLIDMLIRIGSECPNGKALRVPLQCYLVLNCTKMMKQPYRINDVKDFLGCLNTQQLQITDIATEINNLK